MVRLTRHPSGDTVYINMANVSLVERDTYLWSHDGKERIPREEKDHHTSIKLRDGSYIAVNEMPEEFC